MNKRPCIRCGTSHDRTKNDFCSKKCEMNYGPYYNKMVVEPRSLPKEDPVGDLLAKVRQLNPTEFENLVRRAFVEMGYGTTELSKHACINDEGIDGVIEEDPLGLSIICLQAKRWSDSVGRPELQKFVGALQGKKTRKGIFITTSEFTSEARDYVNSVDFKIVLVSGRKFARLLLDNQIEI